MDTGARAFFNAENAVQVRVNHAVATPNVKYAHDIAVVRVEFRKMIPPPFHEFLVFHVEERSPRCAKAIIIVERYTALTDISDRKREDSSDEHELAVVSDNCLSFQAPQPQDSSSDIQSQDTVPHSQSQFRRATSPMSLFATSSYASSSSSTLLASFIPEKPSVDLLTFVNLPTDYLETLGENELCKSFSIPKGTFSVSQLAVLANVVHEHHKGYHLLEYQCYWYAAVIYDAIRQKCQRKHQVEEVKLPAANKLGKFRRIHVKLGRRNTTTEVLKKYEEEWKVTYKKIEECRKMKHYKQELIKEKERADQEAERAHKAEMLLAKLARSSP